MAHRNRWFTGLPILKWAIFHGKLLVTKPEGKAKPSPSTPTDPHLCQISWEMNFLVLVVSPTLRDLDPEIGAFLAILRCKLNMGK